MPDRATPDATEPIPLELNGDVEQLLRTPFDTTLSDPNRLRIQAALHGLAAHLAVLTEVGYVEVQTTWTGRRRTRWYSASPAGRLAFEAHVRALRSIVGAAQLDGT